MAQPALLELRIASEEAPPGGVLQAKVEVTEPKPISTGGGSFDLGRFEEFLGLAANSPNGDAAAVAVIRGSTVRVRLVSSSGGLGLEPDYPILTMTARVPVTAPLGTRVPLTLADGAVFLDPAGTPYPYTFRAGEVTIATGPSIANVSPGSATVPAGGVVTIEGIGFDSSTQVRVSEIALAQTRFVSSTRLEVTLAQAATMHGRQVEVSHPRTNQRTFYFAYQRTAPVGTSAHPLFRAVEPAFPQRFFSAAQVRFEAPMSTSALGLALQNIGAGPVSATLELVTSGGARVGQVVVSLGVNTQAVRSLEEVFGTSCTAVCVVRMTASAPLQVMGLAGDTAQDAATPVLPVADVPMQLTTTMNAASRRPGDTLVLTGAFAPAVLPVISDAYVVLQLPGGQMMSLTSAGLVPGLAPLARRVAPSAALVQELLRTTVPPGTPPGSYQWLSAMTSPGTLNLLTPVSTTTFTIAP